MEERIQNITLNINNKSYPLNIPASQEEIVRSVGKDLNSRIITYQKKFNDPKLSEECVVMASINLITNARMQTKEADDEEFCLGLNQLDQKVQDYLDKIGSLK